MTQHEQRLRELGHGQNWPAGQTIDSDCWDAVRWAIAEIDRLRLTLRGKTFPTCLIADCACDCHWQDAPAGGGGGGGGE